VSGATARALLALLLVTLAGCPAARGRPDGLVAIRLHCGGRTPLEAFERFIANQPVEYGAFFAPTGELLMWVTSQDTTQIQGVSYAANRLRINTRGLTFTHNHPRCRYCGGDAQLSANDSAFARRHGLAEIRAVRGQSVDSYRPGNRLAEGR
jgi:hypothetical protein